LPEFLLQSAAIYSAVNNICLAK